MKVEELKVGLVGCGGIAKSHLNAWRKNGVGIAAVTDVNPDAAKSFAEAAGEGKVFPDAMAMLRSGEVNTISICSPPCAHRDAAVVALKMGVNVLCEKPMADTVESARAVCLAAKESKAVFMTAFRHRFLPAIQKIKELLDEGRIGQPVFFNNIFCGPAFGMKDRWFTKRNIAGGGCIFDTNVHSVDLFRFLIGEVVSQSAQMHRHFEGTDVEDAGVLAVKAENGAVGTMTSTFVAGVGKAFIDIMGQKGEIFFDYGDSDKIRLKLPGKPEWEIIPTVSSNGWTEQILHFIRTLKGECEVPCTCQDGLRAVEIIQAVYK